MEINLKNVVCISLKSHNEEQLDAIGATYNISLESLCEMKNKGCKKIWLHIGGGIVIAGLDTDNAEDVYFSPEYLPMTAKMRKAVLAIKPVKTPKMPTWVKLANQSKPEPIKEVKNEIKSNVIEQEQELDLDTILDKISNTGMQSLTESEKNFLINISKS
jgi:hypothetical protein